MKKFTGMSAVLGALAISLAAQPVGAQTATAPAAAPAAAAATPAAGGNIAAAVKADPELSTFASLAEAAGFGSTFSGQGPLTVLAPSNAAFAKLPAGQLDELKKPEKVAELQQLVLYHVIPAAAPSSALKGTAGDVPTAKTGSTLKVDGTGAALKVDDATVTKADVTASNGTIHVIDTVLTPAAAGSAAAPAPAPTGGN